MFFGTMSTEYREYSEKFSRLVELEREEEMERHRNEMENLSPRQRQAKGRALLGLDGEDEGQGLAGKHLVKFVNRDGLPDTEISVGDLVMVSKNQPLNPDNPTGTVTRKTNYSVTIAFDANPPGFVYSKGLRVDLYVNDVTFQRMLDALDNFHVVTGDKRCLRQVLLGDEEPRFSDLESFEASNQQLDESQINAVRGSLEADDIFLIHGPPGTGKTTTLIESIEQHVDRDFKVLATADSNVAVDNIVDFLNERGFYAVRVGHPARVTETLRQNTLDYIVEKKDKYQEAQKLWSKVSELNDEQDKHQFPSGRWRRGMNNEKIKELAEKGKGSRGVPSDVIESMAKWIEIQETIDDCVEKAKRLEQEAIDEIIEQADVVCTTNSTAGSELMSDRDFDVVVIDEATQATEPSCLIPINLANKVVMAGDHKQLPPTILNRQAEKEGLSETMFERMINIHNDRIKQMLQVQYRMNTDIMDFSSKKFYSDQLEAATAVSDHKLDIDVETSGQLGEIIDPDNVLVFVDTAGKHQERSRRGSTSKENPKEAELVRVFTEELIGNGVSPKDIGVISPYDDQVGKLNQVLDIEGLEVKTVDGFQGREKDVIIISFVRSNDNNEIGFLADLRRLNVSLTRARKKIISVGDSETLTVNETYRELIDYFKETGTVLCEDIL